MDTRAGHRTEELLPRSRGGAADHVLEDLHRSRREALVAELSPVVGGRRRAEHLVDEAFVRAWASSDRAVETADPEAWLRRRVLRLARRTRVRHLDRPTVAQDAEALRRRGLARRRARRTALLAASAITVALAVVGATSLGGGGGGGDGDGGPRPEVVDPRPDGDLDELEPGTHELVLSTDRRVPTVELTLGRGWRVEQGVRHGTGAGVVAVLAADVDRVVRRPCGADGRGLAAVADEGPAMQAALTSAPGLALVAPTEAGERFGLPAEHLRLRVTDAARCLDGGPSTLLVTADGPVTAPPVGSTIDAWVLRVGQRVVVVLGVRGPEASVADTGALRRALDSLVLVPST